MKLGELNSYFKEQNLNLLQFTMANNKGFKANKIILSFKDKLFVKKYQGSLLIKKETYTKQQVENYLQ